MVKTSVTPENPTCTLCGKPLLFHHSNGQTSLFAGMMTDISDDGEMELNQYLRVQLGKYAPETGRIHLKMYLCYECFIDSLLNAGVPTKSEAPPPRVEPTISKKSAQGVNIQLTFTGV